MIKKIVKYTEFYDSFLKSYIERAYKDSFRRGWYISELVPTPTGKWIIKWERKI